MAQHFRTHKYSGYFASVFLFFRIGGAWSTIIRQFLEHIQTFAFRNVFPSSLVRSEIHLGYGLAKFLENCSKPVARNQGLLKFVVLVRW